MPQIGKMTVRNEEITSIAHRDETSKERKEGKAASAKNKKRGGGEVGGVV